MLRGSGSAQSSLISAFTNGQASPQPIVTTAAQPSCGTASSDLDPCFVRSYPSSAIAATAFGLTFPDGFDPALQASIVSPPSIRANASAIWLRLEFSTQTNRTRFIRSSPSAG